MDIQDNQPMRVIEGLLRFFKNPQQTLNINPLQPSAAFPCPSGLPAQAQAGTRSAACLWRVARRYIIRGELPAALHYSPLGTRRACAAHWCDAQEY